MSQYEQMKNPERDIRRLRMACRLSTRFVKLGSTRRAFLSYFAQPGSGSQNTMTGDHAVGARSAFFSKRLSGSISNQTIQKPSKRLSATKRARLRMVHPLPGAR